MSALTSAQGAEDAIVLNTDKVLTSPLAWFRTWRILKRQNPDVIFAINPACALLVQFLRRLGLVRGKVVCIFHSSRLQPRERMTLRPFRWAALGLDALIYVGEAQKTSWQAQGLAAKRNVVIANGVDLTEIEPSAFDRGDVRRRLGLASTDFVIGIVAALRPEKRHQDLISAVAALHATGAPAKLLVIGDGPMRSSLLDQVKSLNLADHVLFVGDQADVRPFIVACDVGALCSDTETFSIAALEILALGVPLVASDVGGMGEIVSDGVNGLLYRARDVGQLERLLGRMADPQAREPMRAAARASVERFDVSRMVERYEALITSLSGEV